MQIIVMMLLRPSQGQYLVNRSYKCIDGPIQIYICEVNACC